MASPETNPDTEPRLSSKVRRRLAITGVVALFGAGAVIVGTVENDHAIQRAAIHTASTHRLETMRSILTTAGINSSTNPKEEVHGCGTNDNYCQIYISAKYRTTGIYGTASALDTQFHNLGLNPGKGIFGTDRSLGEAAGKAHFIVEYSEPSTGADEKVGGKGFDWGASIACTATPGQPKPVDILAPQAGECTAEMAWVQEVPPNSTSGGFH